jgi:hypothetical protein
MPRFVILEHTGTSAYKPGKHWDLMLEADGRLQTWELDSIPSPRRASRALALPDHRLRYLDYEGPLTGDRGEVRQFDAGVYDLVREPPDEWIVRLTGRQVQCQLVFTRDLKMPNLWQVSVEPGASSNGPV